MSAQRTRSHAGDPLPDWPVAEKRASEIPCLETVEQIMAATPVVTTVLPDLPQPRMTPIHPSSLSGVALQKAWAIREAAMQQAQLDAQQAEDAFGVTAQQVAQQALPESDTVKPWKLGVDKNADGTFRFALMVWD